MDQGEKKKTIIGHLQDMNLNLRDEHRLSETVGKEQANGGRVGGRHR